MARSRVIPVIKIAPEFPAIVGNPRLIVPDVAPVVPVAVLRKHCSRSQSNHQQNASDHALHSIPLYSELCLIPAVPARNCIYRM
jgi:hypothetical protein